MPTCNAPLIIEPRLRAQERSTFGHKNLARHPPANWHNVTVRIARLLDLIQLRGKLASQSKASGSASCYVKVPNIVYKAKP